MAAPVNVVDIVPQCDPTIQSRFSSMRFMKVVKKFNQTQKSYISKYNLDNMVKMPEHLMIPVHLLQWLAFHSSNGVFQHKEKRIYFTKEIVDKVFGFSHGTKQFVFDSNDPEVLAEVENLRLQYLDGKGKSIPVKKLESVLLGSESEVEFIRTLILFFISTILCPVTYNFVCSKYLFSLRDSDIPDVENLDFGTLYLEHLWDEIESWKRKIFNDGSDYNRLLWIGGCLPVLAVVYMDFLNFNGNIGPIEYGLPRMSFIKEDFVHVVSVDRNIRSRKSYGMLEIRDISLTPYGNPLAVLPPEHELPEANEFAEALLEHHVGQLAQPGQAMAQGFVQDAFNEAGPYDQEIMESLGSYSIEPDDSDGIVGSLGSYSIEPDLSDGIMSISSAKGHFDGHIGEGLLNIAMAYDELSDSHSAEEIGEGCVVTNPSNSNALSTQVISNVIGDGLEIAMSYAEPRISPRPRLSGPNTSKRFQQVEVGVRRSIQFAAPNETPFPVVEDSSLEKKNRKIRAAKATAADLTMEKLDIDSYVETFYNKFLKRKIFKSDNSPLFVDIGGISVSYEKFYKSFKASGDVTYETMCLHSEIYNDRAKYDASYKPFLKKYMFNTLISDKLMADPSVFDKNWVVGQFNRTLNADFDIPKMDIFNFPTVVSEHWVMLSSNPLHNSINFFDPESTISKADQQAIMRTLACNLNSVFKELSIACKDFEKFKRSNTQEYPCQSAPHDDGIYVMLYSHNWTGKFMKIFSKEVVPKYRMIRAYDMFYSIQNNVVAESFEKRKKRKVSSIIME